MTSTAACELEERFRMLQAQLMEKTPGRYRYDRGKLAMDRESLNSMSLFIQLLEPASGNCGKMGPCSFSQGVKKSNPALIFCELARSRHQRLTFVHQSSRSRA
jgi:hypothetical protein